MTSAGKLLPVLLMIWLAMAGWASVWLVLDLTDDTSVDSSVTFTNGKRTTTLSSVIGISGPMQASVTIDPSVAIAAVSKAEDAEQATGAKAKADKAAAAADKTRPTEQDEPTDESAATSTSANPPVAPASTTASSSAAPATAAAVASVNGGEAKPEAESDDDGGGEAASTPAVATGDGNSALVTIAALILLVGAGLLALLIRTLGPPSTGTEDENKQTPADPPSSLIDDVNAALSAALRARDSAERAKGLVVAAGAAAPTGLHVALQDVKVNAVEAGVRTQKVSTRLFAKYGPLSVLRSLDRAAETAQRPDQVSWISDPAARAEQMARRAEAAANGAAMAALNPRTAADVPGAQQQVGD